MIEDLLGGPELPVDGARRHFLRGGGGGGGGGGALGRPGVGFTPGNPVLWPSLGPGGLGLVGSTPGHPSSSRRGIPGSFTHSISRIRKLPCPRVFCDSPAHRFAADALGALHHATASAPRSRRTTKNAVDGGSTAAGRYRVLLGLAATVLVTAARRHHRSMVRRLGLTKLVGKTA